MRTAISPVLSASRTASRSRSMEETSPLIDFTSSSIDCAAVSVPTKKPTAATAHTTTTTSATHGSQLVPRIILRAPAPCAARLARARLRRLLSRGQDVEQVLRTKHGGSGRYRLADALEVLVDLHKLAGDLVGGGVDWPQAGAVDSRHPDRDSLGAEAAGALGQRDLTLDL